MVDTPDGPKLTLVGKLLVLLVVAGSCYGAYYLFAHKGGSSSTSSGQSTSSNASSSTGAGAPTTPAPAVEIGIVYGTEKKQWMEWAVKQFNASPQGANTKIDLVGMGSLEGAQFILSNSDQAKKVNVWSPASSLYKEHFVQDWQDHNGNNPIAEEQSLALTPMVFVFWQERYDKFVAKYKQATFQTVAAAVQEPGGWNTIAGMPDWGLFKFGHTQPNKSNSGVMTLVLMAYDFANKSRGLTVADITSADFQTWLAKTEHGVAGMSDSTGTMMKDMVLKGPSSYDCLFTYENVVIDQLKNAKGRWGDLHVEYPRYNAWNDNPYYVLDVPWSSKDQRQAAHAFEEFLMSEPVQQQALVHGFRPGNPAVPVKFPESPFVQFQSSGLKIDLTTICDPPRSDVIQNLLISWQRSQGGQ